MKKFEAPELTVLRFEMQETLTSDGVGGVVSGVFDYEGDVEEGW